MPVDDAGAATFGLHQFLIGLRRRHPWLHRARTTALRLDNQHYVYETRHGEDALIVALNLTDDALSLRLSDVDRGEALMLAGTAAPPEQVVTEASVPPHGWLVLQPR